MTGRARALWVVALLLLALGAHHGRRAVIRVFFTDGAGDAAAPGLTRPGGPTPGLAPVERLRVVLIDGLSEHHARALPRLSELCRGGLDLRVDNGFPTVSLPVQHALWTGLTQQQSGVQYRIAPFEVAPAGCLPAVVPGSRAVAESHPEIVRSFGFAETWPPEGLDEAGAREAFAGQATAAVASEARLTFVHVLRVDEAGHASGAASADYAAAADWSDALLGKLLVADPRATWVVLADHGHRPAGGHGGAEPSIRHVRACISGPAVAGLDLPSGRAVHLVDLSRALFDLAGVAPVFGAAGRPLPFALAHPDPEATLPRPSRGRWLVAAALVLSAIALTFRIGAGIWSAPLWLVAAYAGVVTLHGVPSLSIPAIYPPLGRELVLAASGGFALLAGQLYLGRRHGPRRFVALLGVPLLVSAALVVLVAGTPPLVPRWTAELSLWLTLLTGAAVVVALAAALSGKSVR